MIHVIANIEVRAGKLDDFLDIFHRLMPQVLAEEGCLDYGPTRDARTDIDAQVPYRQNVVTVVERWRDMDALESHLASPHMAEYRENVEGMVQDVTLQILEPA
ncbi:MAG: putative quinol monooxygenase [Planctomycetota bacterium]